MEFNDECTIKSANLNIRTEKKISKMKNFFFMLEEEAYTDLYSKQTSCKLIEKDQTKINEQVLTNLMKEVRELDNFQFTLKDIILITVASVTRFLTLCLISMLIYVTKKSAACGIKRRHF